MESSWDKEIVKCTENKERRRNLRDIPVKLLSSIEYIPDWIYWHEFKTIGSN